MTAAAPNGLTSMQRVLTTLGQQEPDRVPLFLLVTMHGARELRLSIRDYYAGARSVVEGQMRMRAKYRHDCLYAFFYASLEVEAFGGETIFIEDGPPNAAAPVIRRAELIDALEPPRVAEATCLHRVLEAIGLMKQQVGDTVPIIGVVMSPFSLPVMQLGFERYLDLLHGDPVRLARLLAVNEAFCIDWANAQLAAGATAICFFDPVSSVTNVSPGQYRRIGKPSAQRTLTRINGPTATHMASGRALGIVSDIAETGTAVLGVSVLEDLTALKSAAAGRLTLLGNLNGVAMRTWSAAEAEAAVKAAIAGGGPGGGFILSDNHGEIPFQVPEEVLLAVSDAVERWGQYPLTWIDAAPTPRGETP